MLFAEAAPLLELIGMAEAARRPLDLTEAVERCGRGDAAVREMLSALEASGLALTDVDEGPPVLRAAGRQYLALCGEVPDSVISFLPQTIDDLHARRALLAAGTILVDEFRSALLSGRVLEHARTLVPAAFAPALEEETAVDLYSAAVALIARLSGEQPAGCVAEEILAVALLETARGWLEGDVERGELTKAAALQAAGSLHGLFELFQDDDVLDLFNMAEPADAAVAGQSPRNRQLGTVDQRLEAWFEPFGWTAPTGYLADREP